KTPKDDWWVIDPRGWTRRNLTEASPKTASSLVRVGAGSQYLGTTADSTLWMLDVASGASGPVAVTNVPAKVTGIVWNSSLNPIDSASCIAIVESGPSDNPTLVRIDLATSAATPVPAPSRSARLVSYLPGSKWIAFSGAEANGSFLWAGDGVSSSYTPIIAED